MKSIWIAVMACAALTSMSVRAQDNDTLAKIKSSGNITVGYRETSVPFSYVTSAGGEPIGFVMDICADVISNIKKQLNLPNLKVTYQSVTSANRVPLVQNGTVDLECGSTTNTVAREQQVAFSLSYVVVGITAGVKKDSGIQHLSDLNGKTVVTTAGTTGIQLLRGYRETANLSVNEINGKDHADSFLLLESGRASAFILDDVLLAGQIANSAHPGDYRILTEALRYEPYGLMFRKDDPQFKRLVDSTMLRMMKSGEMLRLYSKWFMSPIPPKNLNLDFPASEATKQLYQAPTDKGV